MNDSKVLLKVEDFRAISQAEIKLDGITVVAGVAKVLYPNFCIGFIVVRLTLRF